MKQQDNNKKHNLWQYQQAPGHWKLPLNSGGQIAWNAHGVPYVRANSDHDAAVLLGAASYALRGRQIQLFRKAAWGQLAELGGPSFIRIDTLIRTLQLHRAQADILKTMPAFTRLWIQGFCEGLNAVAATDQRCAEMRLLGLEHTSFTVADILAIGRLTGTDVNWPMLFDLFPLRAEADFADIWKRILAAGGGLHATRESDAGPWSADTGLQWLLRANRSGSNCMAVAGQRTLSGKPLLASDPHLNHQLPNLWLLAGVKCPSINAVGLMFPGLPVIGLGRNPQLAWGGTNLRAASSDLVRLDKAELPHCEHQETIIKVRGWRSVKRTLRWSTQGPVVSDALGKRGSTQQDAIAMRWAGHWPSDEITAFLNLMRLQTATGLQAAMAPYAVTGLNILAADCDGNIAMTHAAWLPRRAGFSVEDMVINADQANAAWADRLSSLHLPGTLNPPDGLIASTNNKPQAAPPVSYFFNGEERQQRLRGLTLAAGQMTVETLKHLQTDVQSDNARHMAGLIANWIRQHAIKPAHLDVAQKLASWDGRYTADSQHALLFEGLISALRRQLAGSQPRHAAWWVIQEWAYISNFLLEDIYQLTAPEQTRIMSKSLNVAIKLSQRHGTWGQVHRLSPRHVLSGLPWIGKRWFPSVDLPASGSRETLMKNAHGWIEKPQPSTYGAQARQICDLSDPDHNFFVLLGGQDENASSPHAVDQVKLWADSRYIQMPLTQGEVDKAFDRVWIFES